MQNQTEFSLSGLSKQGRLPVDVNLESLFSSIPKNLDLCQAFTSRHCFYFEFKACVSLKVIALNNHSISWLWLYNLLNQSIDTLNQFRIRCPLCIQISSPSKNWFMIYCTWVGKIPESHLESLSQDHPFPTKQSLASLCDFTQCTWSD